MAKIYLDVDGVFANMDKRIQEVCGPNTPRFSNDIWAKIAQEWRFFWHLELIPDSLRIITMLQHHDLEFLTAKPESRNGQFGLVTSEEDKREWIAYHISPRMKVNCIEGGKNKPIFLIDNPGAILIDDYPRNIDLWNAAGGVGILHINTPNTLLELGELGLL